MDLNQSKYIWSHIYIINNFNKKKYHQKNNIISNSILSLNFATSLFFVLSEKHKHMYTNIEKNTLS